MENNVHRSQKMGSWVLINVAWYYNTFQIDGLPPTPIANPSRAAIEAVLNPLQTDELFFFSNDLGGLMFAKTLAEQIRNVIEFRAGLKKQQGPSVAQKEKPARPMTAEEFNSLKSVSAKRPEKFQKQLADIKKEISSTEQLKSALAAIRDRAYARAIAGLEPLADNGNYIAQYNLATLYRRGQGVAQDHRQAANWFRKAANQGDASSQFYLAVMFTFGQGVAQDQKQAVNWYRKAADQGHEGAQLHLGNKYLKGEGVEKDYVIAKMFFNISSSNGSKEARKAMVLIEKKMTRGQIRKAKDKAREWLIRFAARNKN